MQSVWRLVKTALYIVLLISGLNELREYSTTLQSFSPDKWLSVTITKRQETLAFLHNSLRCRGSNLSYLEETRKLHITNNHLNLLGGNVKYPFGVGSQHLATVSVMGLQTEHILVIRNMPNWLTCYQQFKYNMMW